MKYVFIFMALLATFELMQRSDPYCVACIAAYIFLAASAVNSNGGFTFPSTSYIFFHAINTLILGVTTKAVLWQPVHTYLKNPRFTMTVYVAAELVIYATTFAIRRIRNNRAWVKTEFPQHEIDRVVVGLVLMGSGVAALLISGMLPQNVSTALAQLNPFYALSILIGTYYRCKNTNGTRCITFPVALAILITFVMGLSSFSKEGMFGPIAAWIVAMFAAGYHATVKQIVITATVTLAVVAVFTPVSQYGRAHIDEYPANPAMRFISIVTHPIASMHPGNGAPSAEDEDIDPEKGFYHFYDRHEGLFDRLVMLPIDDALIDRTNQGHQAALINVAYLFVNAVPHVLLPNKPIVNFGNTYAHEIGMLGSDDFTTGISFSPQADAYHVAKWAGVFFIMPVVLLLLFYVADSVGGPLTLSPWGLYFALRFIHGSSEGMLSFPIYTSTTGLIQLLFGAVIASYVAPLLGTLVLGPARRVVVPPAPLRPVPRSVDN